MARDPIRRSEPVFFLPNILTRVILCQIDYAPLLFITLETPNVLVNRPSQVENISYRLTLSIELCTRFANGEAALGSSASVPDELF